MALTNERLRELWFQRWPVMKGGRGSGHYGHAGRPGKHGGSAPGGARLGLAVTDSQHKALAGALAAADDYFTKTAATQRRGV